MSSRRNLREFQVRLTERLKNATVASKETRLGVLINERRCLVDLEEAGEIISIPASTTKVPGTHAWFKGLISHRGTLIGVADIAQMSGGQPSQVGKESRLITLNQRMGVNAAFVVTRMLGLQNLSNMKATQAVRSEVSAGATWQGATWQDERGESWQELKLSALAIDQQFLAVAA